MDEIDYAEMREKIHSAITEAIADEETESTILTGWNLIYEGAHEDGKRSLTFITSNATGDGPLTPWAARGFMDHVKELFFTFTAEDDEEEEED